MHHRQQGCQKSLFDEGDTTPKDRSEPFAGGQVCMQVLPGALGSFAETFSDFGITLNIILIVICAGSWWRQTEYPPGPLTTTGAKDKEDKDKGNVKRKSKLKKGKISPANLIEKDGFESEQEKEKDKEEQTDMKDQADVPAASPSPSRPLPTEGYKDKEKDEKGKREGILKRMWRRVRRGDEVLRTWPEREMVMRAPGSWSIINHFSR